MKTGQDLLDVARRMHSEIGAYQIVLVALDDSGRFATCSYGTTRKACAATVPLCDAIADGISAGSLPSPRAK